MTAIVAYTVTGTSGLADGEQGLATGLTSMTQQVAITVGIPMLSAVAATQSVELTGIHLALTVNVAVTLVSVVFIWVGLRPRGGAAVASAAEALSTGMAGDFDADADFDVERVAVAD